MINQVAQQPDAPTIIYVTHHVEEILPCFNQTLLIKDGRVFEAGDTSKVLSSARMSDFFGVPVEVEQRENRNWLFKGS